MTDGRATVSRLKDFSPSLPRVVLLWVEGRDVEMKFLGLGLVLAEFANPGARLGGVPVRLVYFS